MGDDGFWKMGQDNGKCYLGGERIPFVCRCQYPQKILFQSERRDMSVPREISMVLDPIGSAVVVVKSSWQET